MTASKSGIYKHAFWPLNSKGIADIYLDDDDDFTLGSSKNRNLLYVTMHNIDHAIGLYHSVAACLFQRVALHLGIGSTKVSLQAAHSL